MESTECLKIDVSSLIGGTWPQIIKRQTYEKDGSVLKIKTKFDHVDRDKRHTGIKIYLETTYKGNGEYEGVLA